MIAANFFDPYKTHSSGVDEVYLAVFRALADVGDPDGAYAGGVFSTGVGTINYPGDVHQSSECRRRQIPG